MKDDIGMVIKKVNKYVLNPRGMLMSMCSFIEGMGKKRTTNIIGMKLPLLIQKYKAYGE